jgi:hypothetical protein
LLVASLGALQVASQPVLNGEAAVLPIVSRTMDARIDTLTKNILIDSTSDASYPATSSGHFSLTRKGLNTSLLHISFIGVQKLKNLCTECGAVVGAIA